LNKPSRLPLPVILAALFVFIFTNLFSLLVFDHIPRVHDEISYVFQAKIFLLGKLTVPSPCPPRAFDFTHVINNGRWYGMYPPGFPLLLAAGLAFGTPWIVNPLLAALFVILIYFLGLELYDRRTGTIASVLAALSPWCLIMSSTMMSHPAGLFFLTLFMFFLVRSLRAPTVLNGLLAGAGLGMAVLVRPYSAFLVAIPFALFYGLRFLGAPKRLLKNLAGLIGAGLVFLAILLIYNQITTGHLLKAGYLVFYGKDVLPGIGHSTRGAPHSLVAGAINVGKYLGAMNAELFGWPISSFLGLLPLVLFFRGDPEKARKDLLVAAGFISLLVGLMLYWGTIIFIGARLAYEGVGLLILLTARGLAQLSRRKIRARPLGGVLGVVMIAFTAYAFSVRLPRMISTGGSRSYLAGYTKSFAGVTAGIDRAVRSLSLKRSVVIMKLLYRPMGYFPDGWWGSGFLHDDPLLKREVIYTNEHALESPEIFRCFKDRAVYAYVGSLEKGMLVPLSIEGGLIVPGKPVSGKSTDPSGRKIEWVDNPADIFHVYSPEFRDFLDGLSKEVGILNLDVARLSDEAVFARDRGDFRREAFLLEAALQVERNPEFTYPLLNRLAGSYFKLGRAADALRIRKKIEEAGFKDDRIGIVFPDRGY
jgi:hypothetical protein